ncbi:MAG: hypothetical protein JF588_13085 [Caulobacterales bacterium]|nr:hypothetical protein [Caulobacterales bacterium]
MQNLTKFEISPRGEDFLLRLEGEGGTAAEFVASPEQLDAMIEAADELLDDDDDAFEVEDGDEIYQKPLG